MSYEGKVTIMIFSIVGAGLLLIALVLPSMGDEARQVCANAGYSHQHIGRHHYCVDSEGKLYLPKAVAKR